MRIQQSDKNEVIFITVVCPIRAHFKEEFKMEMQNIFTATLFAIVMTLVAGLQFLMAYDGAIYLLLTGILTMIIAPIPLTYFIWWRSTGYRG